MSTEAFSSSTLPESEFRKHLPDWGHPNDRQKIWIDLIEPDEQNPRTTTSRAEMNQLISNIKKHGLRRPLRVRRGEGFRVILLAGHRRLWACMAAGLKVVTVELCNRELTEGEILDELILDNEHHVDLPPIDRAKAYQRRMQIGKFSSPGELAEHLDLSVEHVRDTLMLLKLIPEVAVHVNSGAIRQTIAREIANLEVDKQLEVSEKVLRGDLKRQDIRILRSDRSKPGTRAGRPRKFRTERLIRLNNGASVLIQSTEKELDDTGIAMTLHEALATLPLRMRSSD